MKSSPGELSDISEHASMIVALTSDRSVIRPFLPVCSRFEKVLLQHYAFLLYHYQRMNETMRVSRGGLEGKVLRLVFYLSPFTILLTDE
jgi:hypothetical protein